MDHVVIYLALAYLAILEIGRNHLLFPAAGPSNSPKKAIIHLGNNILPELRQKKIEQAKKKDVDYRKLIKFSVDVVALYPSVKFEFLKEALGDCLLTTGGFTAETTTLLSDLVLYTLQNQQIF